MARAYSLSEHRSKSFARLDGKSPLGWTQSIDLFPTRTLQPLQRGSGLVYMEVCDVHLKIPMSPHSVAKKALNAAVL